MRILQSGKPELNTICADLDGITYSLSLNSLICKLVVMLTPGVVERI